MILKLDVDSEDAGQNGPVPFEGETVCPEPIVEPNEETTFCDFVPDDPSCQDPITQDQPDFHVLPAPKDGTLDAAIEKATRAAVTLVRNKLENFAHTMSFNY